MVTLRQRRRAQRGNTLLVTTIVVAVLTVVGVGLVRRTTKEMESNTAKRHYDTAVSCADGARELLMSQFRTFGVSPTELKLNETVGNDRLASGHYDSFDIASVQALSGTVGSGLENAYDLANRTVSARLGGTLYRITVVCAEKDSASRQSEVEFLVRFGL